MNIHAKLLCVACTALLAGVAVTAQADSPKNLDFQRLSQRLAKLQANPVLGQYAQAQRALARQAVQQLKRADDKRHAYALYIAERRVDLAKAAAQLGATRDKLVQLQREHDQILLKASRRDAAATRQALARERLQNRLAAERAQRLQQQGMVYSQAAQKAQAEAAQAQALAQSRAHAAKLAKKQAALAGRAVQMMRQQLQQMTAKQGSEGLQMTLGGAAFAVGSTSLRPQAKSHLGKLVRFVQSQPDKHVRIEGYTDSSGNAAVNQSISLKRAESVRDALVAEGVDASRISVAGMGESDPVASNSTASGRAKNRRVVVILVNK